MYIHGRAKNGIEKLKKGSTFTILEEGCAYIVTRDKPFPSRERASVKINRKGETIFVYFARYGFPGAKKKICDDPPLSVDQLIDIYEKKNYELIEEMNEEIHEEIHEEISCSNPLFSVDQLVDIYENKSHEESNALPIEEINEEIKTNLFYYIIAEDREDSCVYFMGSKNPQVVGDGTSMQINRKGKVLSFMLGR